MGSLMRNIFKVILLQVILMIIFLIAWICNISFYFTNGIVVIVVFIYSYICIKHYKHIKERKENEIEEIIDTEQDKKPRVQKRLIGNLMSITLSIVLIFSGNIAIYGWDIPKIETIEKIKNNIINEEDKPFSGIFVIPEKPTTVKSGDKATIKSLDKTLKEIKVSPDDLNKNKQNNLSPYIQK